MDPGDGCHPPPRRVVWESRLKGVTRIMGADEPLHGQRRYRVAALLSGGKDSTLALHLAWQRGLKAEAILTMLPEDPESPLYHTCNLHHASKVAESIGLKWIGFPVKKGDEEEALRKALTAAGAEAFISGGIASLYQKRIFDRVARELGMRHHAPLWGWSPKAVLTKTAEVGMDVVVVAVAAYGLGEEWLGARLTGENIQRLLKLGEKYHLNPTGEGGDLETFVLDAPLYRRRLTIAKASKKWMLDRGVLEIEELQAAEKPGKRWY